MKQIILITLILLNNTILFAQEREIDCPVIGVNPPNAAVSPGENMRFSTSLDESLIKNLNIKINWTVDVGTIISGQGTNEIVVATDGLNDATITASIEVLGLPEICVNKYFDTGIVAGLPIGEPIDNFGEIPNDDVRARTDSLFISLQSDPNSKAFIINYGSRKAVIKRENIIRNHVKLRGYDINRMVFQYKGEEKEIRTIFWIVPEGADASDLN